jgi:hypothetical protein
MSVSIIVTKPSGSTVEITVDELGTEKIKESK